MDQCSRKTRFGSATRYLSIVVSVAVASVSLTTYTIVSSSTEFSLFAPVSFPSAVTYGTLLLIGVVMGFVTARVEMTIRTVVLIIVLVVPYLIYGVAMFMLWISVADASHFQFFLIHAGFRSLQSCIGRGVLTAIGMAGGVLLADRVNDNGV